MAERGMNMYYELLNVENKCKTIRYINGFYEKIENDYDVNCLNPNYFSDILLCIADGHDYISSMGKYEKFKEIGYNICKYIKQDIEFRHNELDIGMFTGLGYICFCIEAFQEKYEILKNFSQQIKQLFMRTVVEKCLEEDIFERKSNNYDMISGLSGCLNYIINSYDLDEDFNNIKLIHEKLMGCFLSNESDLYNFCINRENQTDFEKENERFSSGLIDMGFAHGIIGVAAVTVKYLEKVDKDDIRSKKFLNAVIDIFENEQYKTSVNGLDYWEGKMSYNEFINKEKLMYYTINSSWCYGIASIYDVLADIYQCLHLEDKCKNVIRNIEGIFNVDIAEHNLRSTCICHGYAGVLTFLTHASEKYNIYDPESIDRCVSYLFHMISERKLKFGDMNIFDLYQDLEKFEGHTENLNMLEGSTGITLSLLSTMQSDLQYKKILVI